MPFTFKPFKGMTPADVSKVGKELHKVIDDDALVRYGLFVLEEARKGKEVRLDIPLAGDRPYIVRILNSTRSYSKDYKLSYLVCYEEFGRLSDKGLLAVEGIECTQDAEEV